MLAAKLLSSLSGAAEEKLYVDDVFSAYTYAGTGAAKNIPNGIDLLGQGGMTWIKCRDIAQDNYLYDTPRGVTKSLTSNDAAVQVTGATGLIAWNDQASGYGFQLGSGASTYVNSAGSYYVSWSFRKAPKFFDVVNWFGDGTNNRQIAHSLGATPGLIIVKDTKYAGDWTVYHKDLESGYYLALNTTGAKTDSWSAFNGVSTSTVITLGNPTLVNNSTHHYVAYLFAHDPSADGMIQCGSFTTNGSGLATVNLGWEPQYVMVKATSVSGDWEMLDQSRSWCVGDSNDAILTANIASTELVATRGEPNASGFVWQGALSTTHIYMAIRRPNKPPTVGTQVYQGVARTGTGATAKVTADFAPDLLIVKSRSVVEHPGMCDRLRGREKILLTDGFANEYTDSPASNDVVSFDSMGVTLGPVYNLNMNESGKTFINYFFKRAPGVFDIVCYTGTGAIRTVAHSLGVAPQLLITRSRTLIGNAYWITYSADVGAGYAGSLQSPAAFTNGTDYWNGTSPTATEFTLSANAFNNGSGHTHVAYAFATKAGISKVGSYTGDGTSGKVINCGFSTGARFVLIKRTDANGSWIMWDTARGIVAGPDPHLTLNTSGAEVTTADSIDPDVSGFIVNQLAGITDINVSGATYIFLAFA